MIGSVSPCVCVALTALLVVLCLSFQHDWGPRDTPPVMEGPRSVAAISQLIDPKTVEFNSHSQAGLRDEAAAAAGVSDLLPCGLHNVGTGRWTYEHHPASAGGRIRDGRRVGGFPFSEADPSTARWTPLACSLPDLDWRPSEVVRCAERRGIRSIVLMGGSTSGYILKDFQHWMARDDEDGPIPPELVNYHDKGRWAAAEVRGLQLEFMHMSSAEPAQWSRFVDEPRFFENTLVVFNSVLWDMRGNELPGYKANVNGLADAFRQYKSDHPTNRVVWRSSGTPNWNRLDVGKDQARARERLMNPDAVMVYNLVAAEAMSSRGIDIFDDYLMVAGRPEETRGANDGLHPSTALNVELMRLLLSVICNE
ncbi:hypothetical protein THAOC_31351 [Thalassiosira oceanica]|uniref:SGNH hydrolase-type esterase domain-containing protein n=1 Tax=Thalassiosira oceanica TaxID=159749 RepID=K0R8D8_THAOC|nr:hypothetical protein THAOC_31351 [Thalassiosira oceanica]|eukprot:EJK49738.1 hypothetical protein THAOC_31351 [Thalassiosira oceanica]